MKLGSCLSCFCTLFPTFVQCKTTKTSREVQNAVSPPAFCKKFGKTLVHHEGNSLRAGICIIHQYMPGNVLARLQKVFLEVDTKFQLPTPKNKIYRVFRISQNSGHQWFPSIFNSSGSGTYGNGKLAKSRKLVRFSGRFSTWSVFFGVFQQTKVGNKTQKQNKHNLSFNLHRKLSKSI